MATSSKAKTKSPPRLSNLLRKGTFVKIFVGAPAQEFGVHKDLICYHSPFFSAAFNGKFQEGITQKMTLEDVEPDTFGLVVSWMYTQDLEEFKDDEYSLTIVEANIPLEGWKTLQLGKIWILAQRFLMPALQNQILPSLYDMIKATPIPDMVTFYHLIDEHDAEVLMEVAASDFAYHIGPSHFDECIKLLPSKVVLQVAKILRGKATLVTSEMPEHGKYMVKIT